MIFSMCQTHDYPVADHECPTLVQCQLRSDASICQNSNDKRAANGRVLCHKTSLRGKNAFWLSCNLSPILGLLKTQKNPNTYFYFHSSHHQKLRCPSLACSSGEFAKDISMHDAKFAEISSRVPVNNA